MPGGKDTKQITAEREAERKRQQANAERLAQEINDNELMEWLDRLISIKAKSSGVGEAYLSELTLRRARLLHQRSFTVGDGMPSLTGSVYAADQIGQNIRLYTYRQRPAIRVNGRRQARALWLERQSAML